MTWFRYGRFLYRLTRELSLKYKRALLLGFVVGFAGSLTILRLAPFFIQLWLAPVERRGIVGDFTPTTLPAGIQHLMSMGLTTITPDGTVGPGAAASWEVTESGKTYTFHLDPNKAWHNGKKLFANSVNYNIRDVTFFPKDADTVIVSLKEAYSPFLTLVSKPIFQTGLVGLGPYKVGSIKLKGDTIAYLKLLPVSSKQTAIEYRFYKTESQAITAYKLGAVDKIEDLTDVSELTGWHNTKITSHSHHDWLMTVYFNVKDQRLTEKSFRQALGYAVPKFNEERAYSPINKDSWAYTDTIRHYDYNESQFKKLLNNAASASDSGHLTITTFAPYIETAQAIARSWTILGIPTAVRVVNDLTGGFQILLSVQTIPPDPDQYPLWHSTQQTTNLTGYASVKIDKLLEDGRRELERDKRKKLYFDFAKRLVDDAPAIFLYYPKTYTVERIKRGLK